MTSTLRIPRVIVANNPDHGLSEGLWWLKSVGEFGASRNGPVLRAPAPVITTYPDPRRRVMFSPMRDANPFFHLYEACWMLAGKHDAASVARYAAQMESFADNGDLWGAYGWRWRSFFGFDQLQEIIDILRKDSTTRRAVLSMWSPSGDLVSRPEAAGSGVWASKDVPCNTHVYFDATGGTLDMTVCNRSNDIVWGAYGANVVHMSMLHEFIACATRIPLGHYHQISNNYHMYTDRPDVQRLMKSDPGVRRDAWAVNFLSDNRYHYGMEYMSMWPDFDKYDPLYWLGECEDVVNNPTQVSDYQTKFFGKVVQPMMQAHAHYKVGDFEAAYSWLTPGSCYADDWRSAGLEWLERRQVARKAKEAGNVAA